MAGAKALRSFAAIELAAKEVEAAADDAATQEGFPPRPTELPEWRDARAKQTAVLDQASALRRDLADLVADAMAVFQELHPDALLPVDVETDREHAPRLLGGIEVNALESLR